MNSLRAVELALLGVLFFFLPSECLNLTPIVCIRSPCSGSIWGDTGDASSDDMIVMSSPSDDAARMSVNTGDLILPNGETVHHADGADTPSTMTAIVPPADSNASIDQVDSAESSGLQARRGAGSRGSRSGGSRGSRSGGSRGSRSGGSRGSRSGGSRGSRSSRGRRTGSRFGRRGRRRLFGRRFGFGGLLGSSCFGWRRFTSLCDDLDEFDPLDVEDSVVVSGGRNYEPYLSAVVVSDIDQIGINNGHIKEYNYRRRVY
ncbi:hypothetical protein BV898_12037 [Hypsibius exemplaris]|uniref:Uncharacterized protein n=1 Tax=Hypsibius exemplaris TaxID=2072580 RepID=A0A1W0WET7_HYPEX|nr:hypothetical protein BV898_12037 [Hypsibius exemplaris]